MRANGELDVRALDSSTSAMHDPRSGGYSMSLDQIEHIVVLVMENRSFDHLLGHRFSPADALGVPQLVNGKLATIARRELLAPRFTPGPHHEYDHVKVQLGEDASGVATMSGFVEDYTKVFGVKDPSAVMGYYDAKTLPVYDFFADNYCVCERWFCSVPGPTLPNRCFQFAGHSDGIVDNGHLALHVLTHHTNTIFDHLSAHQVSWASYYHDVSSLRFFKQFTFTRHNIFKVDQFYAAARAGTLPAVSWIDPNFTVQGALHLPDQANDDHPPADLRRGQALARSVYEALRANQQAWQKTLFILTYDEHGGFFDHVPPPVYSERAPGKNPLFNRYGVRVPTFLISPWVAANTTLGDVPQLRGVDFEHTSIAKTIFDRFCPDADVRGMGERLLAAPSLRDALQTTARVAPPPPCPPLPATDFEPKTMVGGTSLEPVPLSEAQPGTDFHRLIAAVGAHAERSRPSPPA